LLLEVNNLKVSYKTINGISTVLEDFSLKMEEGQIISIVGESGSGKSTLGQAVTKLLPMSGVVSGEILFENRDVVKLTEDQMTIYRGTSVFMIFQNPLNSLNPVKRVGYQLIEAIRIRSQRKNENLSENDMHKEAVETLKIMRLPDPEEIMKRYPHELSGGQVQRVVISMAIILKPRLLIAYEPTTALDVTIQAQVINLLKQLNKEFKMSIIFITHDLSLAYVLSDRILVMYAGRIAENSPAENIVKKPLHPYTEGLLRSVPSNYKSSGELYSIPGSPPSFFDMPTGCRFNPRCNKVFDKCRKEEPKLINYQQDIMVRCWLYE